MPKDDLYVSEKRWQRKRLFRKRSPVSSFAVAIVVLAALTVLAWWLEWLPDVYAGGSGPP